MWRTSRSRAGRHALTSGFSVRDSVSLLGLRAVLFDVGGTLDGDGRPWCDRFCRLYAAARVILPDARLRAAFDHAERRAATDQRMAVSDLDRMVDLHVGWQLAFLRLEDDRLRARLVRGFVA